MTEDAFGGGPGGIEYDEGAFREGSLRADLCEIATHINYQHGAKTVDAILAHYDVKPKRSIKKVKKESA